MLNHLEIGSLGEDIACRFMRNKGFRIITRNYWKKWGEIDIVVQKDGIVRFVEVKSSCQKDFVSRETKKDVTHVTETQKQRLFKSEDAVDANKVKRMRRVIQSYLSENIVSSRRGAVTCVTAPNWQFDIIAVSIDVETKQAKVRWLEKMIL